MTEEDGASGSTLLDSELLVDSTTSEVETSPSLIDDSFSEDEIPHIDTTQLHKLVLQSERWRNYSFNIGYELSQFKKMLTMCDDATIKVRRLLHNFEERMEDTQEQVWDENYQLKPGFDFKDISVAGLRDIILLHDWWAANAPGKTPEEMRMTYEEFMAFRRRCNKISYNLRKNQYAQLLAVRIDRAQRRISDIEDILLDRDTLHWDDKYGESAKKDEDKPWSVEEANAKARARVKLLAQAEDIIDEVDVDDQEERDVSHSTKASERRDRISKFVDVELDEVDTSDRLVIPSKEAAKNKRVSTFVDVELDEIDISDRMALPSKDATKNKKVSQFVDVKLDEIDTSNRMALPSKDALKGKKVSQFVDVELDEVDTSDKLVVPSRDATKNKKVSQFVDVELDEIDTSDKMALPSKDALKGKKVSEFVDVELDEIDNSDRAVIPSKDATKNRKVSQFVDVELDDIDRSDVEFATPRKQLAFKRLSQTVLNGEATCKECLEMEKQYKADAKKLVERTMNYLKHLGLVETEADVERLALVNASSRNPELSQRWLGEIQTQRERLDSSIGLMRTQRKSLQGILDNVAKMETEIQELKQRNKRIFDICMKAGKKVKGVDKQVRNRMLMDKIGNEQRIFELKQLVKKARSQHLDDFSSLEKMRKEVDEQQSAYDQKVRDFKEDIGLTKEAIDSLMVGIYNKFQDEILEHDNKR